jgi:hypothetical protein
MYVYVCVYMHSCKHACSHYYVFLRERADIYMYVCMYIYIYIYIYTFLHIRYVCIHFSVVHKLGALLYIYIYIYIYTHTHIFV